MAKKVLVVDDSSTVRQQVGMALTEAGYTVVEATDGVDGIEKLAADKDLALIVCDVNMPRMDGLQFLEKLHRPGLGLPLPVLMLTTEGKPNLIARARELGAKGWIIKPFKDNLLVAAVRKVVGDV